MLRPAAGGREGRKLGDCCGLQGKCNHRRATQATKPEPSSRRPLSRTMYVEAIVRQMTTHQQQEVIILNSDVKYSLQNLIQHTFIFSIRFRHEKNVPTI